MTQERDPKEFTGQTPTTTDQQAPSINQPQGGTGDQPTGQQGIAGEQGLAGQPEMDSETLTADREATTGGTFDSQQPTGSESGFIGSQGAETGDYLKEDKAETGESFEQPTGEFQNSEETGEQAWKKDEETGSDTPTDV